MMMQYLRQRAATWVSAFVLIGGLAISCMLVFLQRVTIQTASDLTIPVEEVDNDSFIAS
jgi:hypothetical protein